MRELRLVVRTPTGIAVDAAALSITAEDETGWFGVLPGREDVVATLPPGLLVYRAAEQEVFVAIAGGLLDLERGVCRVLTRDAVASDDLDAVSDIVLRHVQRRSERREEQSGIMEELVREALRRLAARERV